MLSPTLSINVLKYILVVDAQKKRDIVTEDLPAQFLQTNMDKEIYLWVSDPLVLLLVERNPERWNTNLRKENRPPVICMRCKKAIYGTLNAAILTYKNITKFFSELGFHMNTYEPCVWNKIITNKQYTIIFYVDDPKINDEDTTVVTMIINQVAWKQICEASNIEQQVNYHERKEAWISRNDYHHWWMWG